MRFFIAYHPSSRLSAWESIQNSPSTKPMLVQPVQALQKQQRRKIVLPL